MLKSKQSNWQIYYNASIELPCVCKWVLLSTWEDRSCVKRLNLGQTQCCQRCGLPAELGYFEIFGTAGQKTGVREHSFQQFQGLRHPGDQSLSIIYFMQKLAVITFPPNWVILLILLLKTGKMRDHSQDVRQERYSHLSCSKAPTFLKSAEWLLNKNGATLKWFVAGKKGNLPWFGTLKVWQRWSGPDPIEYNVFVQAATYFLFLRRLSTGSLYLPNTSTFVSIVMSRFKPSIVEFCTCEMSVQLEQKRSSMLITQPLYGVRGRRRNKMDKV